MDFESLFNRLLTKGGLCYEQALFLYGLLRLHGFSCQLYLTQVLVDRDFTVDKPLDHAVILVSVEGRSYLVDNGFGFRSLEYPIPIDFTKNV